jgi:hypothetical protein
VAAVALRSNELLAFTFGQFLPQRYQRQACERHEDKGTECHAHDFLLDWFFRGDNARR